METQNATQQAQAVSIVQENEQSSTSAETKKSELEIWLDLDKEAKKKAEFKNKLKYGDSGWLGHTTLPPGGRIRVIGGRIIVD